MRGFLNIILERAADELRAPILLALLGLAGMSEWGLLYANAAVKYSRQESNTQALTVHAGFADKQSITPDAPIELTVNRPLAQGEGRLAVVVGGTDLTDLFVVSAQGLKYNVGKSFPLPLGATELTVYLVGPGDDWREVSRLQLRVGHIATIGTESGEAKAESQPGDGANAEQAREQPQSDQPLRHLAAQR